MSDDPGAYARRMAHDRPPEQRRLNGEQRKRTPRMTPRVLPPLDAAAWIDEQVDDETFDQ